MSGRAGHIAVALLTAMGIGLPVVAATTTPAWAAWGNCGATRETRAQPGLDSYRARASCSSLSSDGKARAKLVRYGGPDYTSSWFTTLNKYYYTGWFTCYAGCHAAHEVHPK
jgi:hypothetical protein